MDSNININTFITKNYKENIAYFQSFHPEVLQKISELESAMQNGHWKQRYELEYYDNGFDVLELSTNKKLYNNNSNQYTKLTTKAVNYNINESCFETFQKQDLSTLSLDALNEEKEFTKPMQGFLELIQLTSPLKKEDINLKKLDKFIFFGVGLGLHITSIDDKISSNAYFIIEDDLELFRLSMLTTNYAQLSQTSQLFFSIFDDNNEFINVSNRFLDYQSYTNHYIKFFHMLSHEENKINQFQIAVSMQPHQRFFYNDMLLQNLQPLNYLFDEYKYLTNKSSFLNERINKKPFLLIAAGPSLDKNMAWLKQNHEDFVIVAISATVIHLHESGIHIDIIIHLDGFHWAFKHFGDIDYKKELPQTLLICSDKTIKELVDIFDKKNVFLFENGTTYKADSLKPTAPCVGSMAFQILLILKAKAIYLLGLDLSVEKQSGKDHFSAHQYSYSNDLKKEHLHESETTTYKRTLFEVEGNINKTVFTTLHFFASIDLINKSSQLFKSEDQSILNISNGAKFLGTNSINTSEIKIQNQDNICVFSSLLQSMEKNSINYMSGTDIYNLEQITNVANALKSVLITLKKKSHNSHSDFFDELKIFYIDISNENNLKYDINKIIYTYLRYIIGYIYNYYNQDIKLKTVHERLQNILYSYMIKIVDFYLDTLQKDCI